MTHELIAAKVAKGDFDFTMTLIIEGSIPYELYKDRASYLLNMWSNDSFMSFFFLSKFFYELG